jgi:hypothetical protein
MKYFTVIVVPFCMWWYIALTGVVPQISASKFTSDEEYAMISLPNGLA